MNTLGIWDGHDSGAALLVDGSLVAAVNEERLTRRKLEIRFPARSIEACLSIAGLQPSQVHAVGASTSDVAKTLGRFAPWTKERYYLVRRRKVAPGVSSRLTRRAKYRMTTWPPNPLTRAASGWLLRRTLGDMGFANARFEIFDHHECHALGAAYASGFNSCAVLTIDGLGDGLSSTISVFRDGTLRRVAASPASDSLGVLFEHVTTLLNMRELEDEGKVMALADYASPVSDSDNPLLQLLRVADGRIHSASGDLRSRLAAIHWRVPNEQFAFMAQRLVERVAVALAQDAVRMTGERRLVVTGGVASNIKATRLARLSPGVDRLSVFPHMGDGGLALGAAVAASRRSGVEPRVDATSLALGPAFDDQRSRQALEAKGLRVEPANDLEGRVAGLLSERAVVMWFQGRMEYGPRALGQRSVLGRPDSIELRDRVNLAMKRRVWYQPFCPSMLMSDAARLLADWDGPDLSNPHMTMAYQVKPDHRPALAAVIGVDGSCRPQIVADDAPTRFAGVLREMHRRTGYGVVLNTSYNVHGEPLVCTPEEAVDVFLRSGADALALGPYLTLRGGRG